MKEAYTARGVAKICEVNEVTVAKWMDNKIGGRERFQNPNQILGGYWDREGKKRMVKREDLIVFLKVHGMYDVFKHRLE